MTHCVLHTKLLPVEEAHLSIQDRGFRYGDGLFETIAVYGGIPYQWDLHLERLNGGLKALKIALDTSGFEALATKLISKNGVKEGTLRIAVSRGVGSEGYLPKPSITPTVVMEAENNSFKPPRKVELYLSRWRQVLPSSMPTECKTMQGLSSTLARMEAAEHGCFDSLLLTKKSHVSETSSANIFWFKGDLLYTPSLANGIIAGTTRTAIKRLSPFVVREGNYKLESLLASDEAFITNTRWQILHVHSIKNVDKKWNSHERTRKLHELLRKDIKSHVAYRKT